MARPASGDAELDDRVPEPGVRPRRGVERTDDDVAARDDAVGHRHVELGRPDERAAAPAEHPSS